MAVTRHAMWAATAATAGARVRSTYLPLLIATLLPPPHRSGRGVGRWWLFECPVAPGFSDLACVVFCSRGGGGEIRSRSLVARSSLVASGCKLFLFREKSGNFDPSDHPILDLTLAIAGTSLLYATTTRSIRQRIALLRICFFLQSRKKVSSSNAIAKEGVLLWRFPHGRDVSAFARALSLRSSSGE